MVDALADKRLYEQELARMRKENAFLEDQARGRHTYTRASSPAPISSRAFVICYSAYTLDSPKTTTVFYKIMKYVSLEVD